MNNKLTATEIYTLIQTIIHDLQLKHANATEDKATRRGNIYAVRDTWYYFNNQDEFNELYLIKQHRKNK